MAQYTINGGNNSFNITNSFDNEGKNSQVADDRSQLLTWLSPLEPRLLHHNIQERRVDDVGKWVFETEEFKKWCGLGEECEGCKPILFFYGDPGVGKTFISSLVVDRLGDQARGQNAAVTCFYFDWAPRKEQSATSMLGSLLRQMVSGMERIPEEISRAFKEQRKIIGGRGPRLVDIVGMLEVATSSRPTFMCIDGLDECVGVQLPKVLGSLKQILDNSPVTRIFISGRFHIRGEVERALAGRVVTLSIAPAKGDIIEYLHARLGEDETRDAMNERLEADILEKIPQRISQIFQLVSLNVEAILQESTIYRRREMLSNITDGSRLGDTYGTMIERIEAQGAGKSRLGMDALMWITHAERPLTEEELCQALAIDPGSTTFNVDNVPSISTVVGCCQGLITVDKETSTVRLTHFTLKEYLSSHPYIFGKPHSTIAEICLTYLNSELVKRISPDATPGVLDTPFLKYSSIYWGIHAERELSTRAQSLALQLFQEYDRHVSIKLLLEQVEDLSPPYFSTDPSTSRKFSGLHCASFFGIVDVVDALLDMGCHDINKGDLAGYTPLAWAAHNGHGGVAKMLLEQEEIIPDKPDSKGQTPLFRAVCSGHEGVVEMLLGRAEVNPDKLDNDRRTPLLYAAMEGHEGAVKTLLCREEVDPDRADCDGQTPVHYAAFEGHEEVVKLLLGRKEVNPDKQDNDGSTPLSSAAWGGSVNVVKILLARKEVNPDKPDSYGDTPLSCAARAGREEVVKILLEQEVVSPDKPNSNGRTPLSFAAQRGYAGVVKILLARKEVNPARPDSDGQTPALCAAENGKEEVLKILLDMGGVNPETADKHGRTPLSLAAEKGHEGMVKVLLEKEGVNPDRSNNVGRTPLSLAAEKGHEGVVKILLEQKGVNPDESNNVGRTPLSFAAQRGHEGVVKMLLGRVDVNPHRCDTDSQTPLMFAARYGHKKVMAVLQLHQKVFHDAI